MGIRISGIGAYVPDRIVTNEDLTRTLDTSNEWIVEHTGIRQRYISDAGEAPSDMACQAAQRCLRDARAQGTDVDLIVVASVTPDQSQPAMACMMQEKLGVAARQCPAFDVNSVCSGFVFALDVAQSMMLANPQQFGAALVIGADAFSRIVDWRDRRTAIFFGDGAGAVLLTQSDRDERRIHFQLGSDGRGSRCIEVPAGGAKMPASHEVIEKRLNKFSMNGPRVWEFAVDTVPRVIRRLLADHGLRPRDLDLLVLHQSNLRMIECIMSSLELSMDQTITTLETHGNTAAASIPITLHAAGEQGRLAPGARVLLCGFGGGLSWGAALLEW